MKYCMLVSTLPLLWWQFVLSSSIKCTSHLAKVLCGFQSAEPSITRAFYAKNKTDLSKSLQVVRLLVLSFVCVSPSAGDWVPQCMRLYKRKPWLLTTAKELRTHTLPHSSHSIQGDTWTYPMQMWNCFSEQPQPTKIEKCIPTSVISVEKLNWRFKYLFTASVRNTEWDGGVEIATWEIMNWDLFWLGWVCLVHDFSLWHMTTRYAFLVIIIHS